MAQQFLTHFARVLNLRPVKRARVPARAPRPPQASPARRGLRVDGLCLELVGRELVKHYPTFQAQILMERHVPPLAVATAFSGQQGRVLPSLARPVRVRPFGINIDVHFALREIG